MNTEKTFDPEYLRVLQSVAFIWNKYEQSITATKPIREKILKKEEDK